MVHITETDDRSLESRNTYVLKLKKSLSMFVNLLKIVVNPKKIGFLHCTTLLLQVVSKLSLQNPYSCVCINISSVLDGGS